ncbi:MAG: hypothetical protein WCF16_02525 [Alphaproteobacteria bacterium]
MPAAPIVRSATACPPSLWTVGLWTVGLRAAGAYGADGRPRGVRLVPRCLSGGLAAIAVLALLAGCATAPKPSSSIGAIIDPYGQTVLIGPDAGFDPARPPPGWRLGVVGGGTRPASRVKVAEKAGVLALRWDSDAQETLLGRDVQAPLLAMPYLRWGWYLEPGLLDPVVRQVVQEDTPDPTGTGVPLRLLVAFRGGGAVESGAAASPLAAGLPAFDRAVSLEWSLVALPKVGRQAGNDAVAFYVIRQGASAIGRWVVETVDLSRIYAELWPQDRLGDVSVVFVGVAGGGLGIPSAGYVAEVALSP